MTIKEAEEKTMGGILLPSTAQGGEVVAVGERRTIGKNKIGITVPITPSLCFLCCLLLKFVAGGMNLIRCCCFYCSLFLVSCVLALLMVYM